MKPRIKEMTIFVKIITFGFAAGITLAPFGIYIRKEYLRYKRINNHEKIHWQQQMEMLIIFFYLWYFFEWIYRLFTNFKSAYKSISFEKEAYTNDKNYEYLENRKRFSWIKYL